MFIFCGRPIIYRRFSSVFCLCCHCWKPHSLQFPWLGARLRSAEMGNTRESKFNSVINLDTVFDVKHCALIRSMWICERDVVSDTRKIKLVEIGLWRGSNGESWSLAAAVSPLTNPIISYLKCIYFGAIRRISVPFAAIRSIDMISSHFHPPSFNAPRSTRTWTPPKTEWMNDAYVVERRNRFLNVCLHFGVWLNGEIRAAGVRSIFASFLGR